MKRLIITTAALIALAVPTNAAALQYLSVGNARHELEGRFEHEEEEGSGTDELANCYHVSSTHVNCYSEEHFSAEGCRVVLWRVWETTDQRQRQHNQFTMHTKGYNWGASCQG